MFNGKTEVSFQTGVYTGIQLRKSFERTYFTGMLTNDSKAN